jgi:hypothetical protein
MFCFFVPRIFTKCFVFLCRDFLRNVTFGLRTSLSRPLSAIDPAVTSCPASAATGGCRFKRKFWRQDLRPAATFVEGRSYANLAALKQASRKVFSIDSI